MTVQKDVTKNIYVGNGSTRTFPFTFECPAEHPEYIKVYLMQDDGTALATSDYQLDMDARQITYPSSGTALPEGKKLVIMRELPLQQMMNLVNNGPYFAEDIETAFDECVMAMQQIAEKLNRSIIMSVDIDGDTFVNEVPFEAGKSFRIADDGKSIVLTEDPARVIGGVKQLLAETTTKAEETAANTETTKTNTEKAKQYAEAASDSKDLAKRWAEATDSPDYTTSKSAKTWAGEAKDARDEAKDTAVNLGNPVVNITEDKGTVTVSKSDGSSSNFTTFPKFVEIPANADLNDYKQEGFYICKTNRDAATLQNCPMKIGFLMEVYTTTYEYDGATDSCMHQRIITFSDALIYSRAYGTWDGGKWYSWQSTPAIGTILPFAGANSIPEGYLVCDGSAISRTTYAQLYAVIGNTYGAGDGSTTFNVPNLKGRYIEGQNNAAVGKVWEAGLPNITGGLCSQMFSNKNDIKGGLKDNLDYWSGALNTHVWNTITTGYNSYSGGDSYGGQARFDASKSNAIYGKAGTVQPPAVTMRYIIKY